MNNKPRPYSTLRDGRIVWVTPEEHAQTSQGGKKRSRLESDTEVRARLKPAVDKANQNPWSMWFNPTNINDKYGKDLDDLLVQYKLEPRHYIEETV